MGSESDLDPILPSGQRQRLLGRADLV